MLELTPHGKQAVLDLADRRPELLDLLHEPLLTDDGRLPAFPELVRDAAEAADHASRPGVQLLGDLRHVLVDPTHDGGSLEILRVDIRRELL